MNGKEALIFKHSSSFQPSCHARAGTVCRGFRNRILRDFSAPLRLISTPPPWPSPHGPVQCWCNTAWRRLGCSMNEPDFPDVGMVVAMGNNLHTKINRHEDGAKVFCKSRDPCRHLPIHSRPTVCPSCAANDLACCYVVCGSKVRVSGSSLSTGRKHLLSTLRLHEVERACLFPPTDYKMIVFLLNSGRPCNTREETALSAEHWHFRRLKKIRLLFGVFP